MSQEEINKAIDSVIATIKWTIEKKNNATYLNENERKFALQLLSSKEIKEWMKQKHCPSLKDFII